MRSTRKLVAGLRESLGLDVYAYSMFHVFFEQARGERGGGTGQGAKKEEDVVRRRSGGKVA